MYRIQAVAAIIPANVLLAAVSAHYAYYVMEGADLVITDSVVLELPSEMLCAAMCASKGCHTIGFEQGLCLS